MKAKIFALTLGMLFAGSLAHAMDIGTGTIEIAGKSSAAFVIDLDGDNTFDVGLDGFYYLMPDVGVGPFLDFSKTFGDAAGYTLGFGPQAIYSYSLDEALNSYGRVGLGYLRYEPDGGSGASGWTFVAAGGVKYFVSESFSANVELSYTHEGGDFDNNVITALVGISVYVR